MLIRKLGKSVYLAIEYKLRSVWLTKRHKIIKHLSILLDKFLFIFIFLFYFRAGPRIFRPARPGSRRGREKRQIPNTAYNSAFYDLANTIK
jgi:hypothetical protein